MTRAQSSLKCCHQTVTPSFQPTSSSQVSTLPEFPHALTQAPPPHTDPSEYPDHHTFYAFSTADTTDAHIAAVIEEVSSGSSRSIKKTFEDLLCAFHQASREEDDGEAEEEAYEAYDEDDGDFGAGRLAHTSLRPKKLQQYVPHP